MSGQPTPGSNNILTFDVTNLALIETTPGQLVLPPANVFDRHAHIRVEATITFAGALADILANISHCEFAVALESIGPGYEGVLDTVEQDPAGNNPYTLSLEYDMAKIADKVTPGVYHLAATVIVHGRTTPGNKLIQFPVMGFAETAVMITDHPA